MILVNLLPHREESRKRRKQAFNALLVMSAIAGVALGGLGWFYYNLRIGVQEDVNSFIAAENAQLAIKIKDVEGVEAEIAALREGRTLQEASLEASRERARIEARDTVAGMNIQNGLARRAAEIALTAAGMAKAGSSMP